MNKKECLEILDEIDTLRRKSEYNPNNSAEYMLRVASAIIAQKAGFKSRTEWMDELKKDRTTKTAKYYYFYPNVNLRDGVALDGYYIPEEDNKQ